MGKPHVQPPLEVMVKLNAQTHDLLMCGGFEYDAKKDKYYQRTEAVWDAEKRIEKGRKQFAVPAKSMEEFAEGEVKMVDTLLARLKEKAQKEGTGVSKDDDDEEAEVTRPTK